MDLENAKKVTVTSNSVYKACVKVGRDTIENVEYFIFDHSWFNPKETKTFKDKLENLWDTVTTPYYRVKNKTRDIYWEIRYGFQRMFKGYDYVDTFSTFDKFIKRYSKILTDYRKKYWGYPGELTEEEWDNIVDEMIYHLRYMDEETVVEELENGVPEDWSVSGNIVFEIMNKHKDAFFELFSKHFYDLWD